MCQPTTNINNTTALLLAGCSSSSPMIPDIFLLSLYYERYTAVPDTAQVDYSVNNDIANIVGDARLAARVGYFGICVSADGGSWLCSNNATTLANEVAVDQDPLNLIWLASQFKDMIVFPYLLLVLFFYSYFPTSLPPSLPLSLCLSLSCAAFPRPSGKAKEANKKTRKMS